MNQAAPATARRPAQNLPESLVRALRHEVGDLLQTVYASVAILQERLPRDWSLERRVLTDLRGRAEVCRNLIDNVHDFVCPIALTYDEVDLTELAASLVLAAGPRYPHLDVRVEAVGSPRIQADPRRAGQVGSLLLASACHEARQRVLFRTAPGARPGEAEWTVTDDGTEVPAEQMDQLFEAVNIARDGRLGVGLALARKLVHLHGGQITADNLPEGGFQLKVVWPSQPLAKDEGKER